MFLVELLDFKSAGFGAQTAETPQVAKIKAPVRKRGTGEKSKVRITLENGATVKG